MLLTASSLVAALAATTTLAPSAAASNVPVGKNIPVIISFSGNTDALPAKGGNVTLSGRVELGTSCSITVSPTFKGFTSPRTFACGNGSFSKKISVPPQKAAVLFGFTLAVKGAGGITDSSEVPVAVGVAPPPFAFSPRDLVFPVEGVGVASAPQSVTVTNTSRQPAGVAGLSIEGGSAPTDFTLSSGTCIGAELSANETCSFTVSFNPREAGDRNTYVALGYEVTVVVKSKAKGQPPTTETEPETLNMHLGGEGAFADVALTGPNLTSQNSAQPVLQFGTQAYQVASAPPEQVKITNVGIVPLNIGAATLVSGNTSDFSVTSDCGATIDIGQACLITGTFMPEQTGVRSAILELTDNAKGGDTAILLKGTGAYATTSVTGPGLMPNQPVGYKLSFGSTAVGKSVSVTLVIANTSSVVLKFGGGTLAGTNPNDFDFVPGDCAGSGDEMNPNSSCSVILTFSPSLPVFRTATLTIVDNTADLGETISLSGTGTGSS